MAGDWIKFEVATLDKPEVLRMAELLNVKRDEMLGILLRYFSWLDRTTGHGFVQNLSRKSLDDVLHVSGFSAVLESVGWAKFDDDGWSMTVPNYERHNGKPAKTRASDQKRKRDDRLDSVQNLSEKNRTREEKRSLSKDKDTQPAAVIDLLADVDPQVAKDWTALRKKRRAEVTKTAVDGIRAQAAKAGMTLQAVLEMCCERGWQGFKAEWVADKASGPPPAISNAHQPFPEVEPVVRTVMPADVRERMRKIMEG